MERGQLRRVEEEVTDEDLRLAELSMPGHKATRDNRGRLVLTPTAEFQAASLNKWRAEQQGRLARAAQLSAEVEPGVA